MNLALVVKAVNCCSLGGSRKILTQPEEHVSLSAAPRVITRQQRQWTQALVWRCFVISNPPPNLSTSPSPPT
jgi:hypothetical protein